MVLVHLTSGTAAHAEGDFVDTCVSRVSTFMGVIGLNPPSAELVKNELAYLVKCLGG